MLSTDELDAAGDPAVVDVTALLDAQRALVVPFIGTPTAVHVPGDRYVPSL